jgi:glycogen operon protein
MGEFASRLSGSSDLYEDDGRRPHASINFVTAHDGFTLADLVAYEVKRNEANGEHNRDGSDDNRSWNCGAEGPTQDWVVLALRRRQRRNLMATLVLSQGVPMLLAGDELGRTQSGNNNAYPQDNEISWLDWEGMDVDFFEFCRRLIAYRQANPALRRSKFLTGAPDADGMPDAAWFTPEGDPMGWEHWGDHLRQVVLWLNGDLEEHGPRGERVRGTTLLMAVNAEDVPMPTRVPGQRWGGRWRMCIDTAEESGEPAAPVELPAGDLLEVSPRSLVLFEVAD